MTTIESLREWFMGCPAIQNILGFNTDYLGDESGECTIYSIPTNLAFTEDVVGNITYKDIQKQNFLFALRAPYGDDVSQNLDNLKVFDEIKDWMYKQNTLKNFPDIEEGEVKYIMPIQTEFISSAEADTAMYQMRCEVKYWRKQ